MSIIGCLSRVSDLVFGKRLSEKFQMAANVLLHEWHVFPPSGNLFSEEFANVSDDEIREGFKDLDPESLDQILRYVTYKRDLAVPENCIKYFFYNYHALYRPEEIRQIPRQEKELKEEAKKYYSSRGLELGFYESLLRHHGLKDMPAKVQEYLHGGVFLDVGACYGDSALVFAKHYQPGKIFSFEPSAPNREIFLENMRGNGVPPSQYEVVPLGLGKECYSLKYCEIQGTCNSLQAEAHQEGKEMELKVTTCDQFCSERKLSNVKLIKADIEGMGLDMLLGSGKVIRENRPVLSLSIYHNRDELFGIYQALKGWNLNYHIETRMLGFPRLFTELSLLAWPEELNS